ncbi:MAG: flagellar filament capping protein FliD, partial [Halioglobus sp.]|nr:flagellar filament capping protein FliD [Halioglobus sp.]
MITAAGVGSGLDIESLVTQLVAAERGPVESRILQQDARITSELSAFGTFKGALSAFQTSLADLNVLSSFGRRTGVSSNSDVLEATSDGTAVNGSYDIAVTQLAKAHSLASGSYATTDEIVGTGTLTLRFGTTDYTPPDPGPEAYNGFTVNPERGVATITIDSSNNTLEGVRDAINAAEVDVNATIVNDGNGFRLLLSSQQTGLENSIEISVDDTGDGNSTDAAGLSALAFNSAATNLSQTVAAQDANFTVNGLPISTPENVANDVIEGIDLTLKDVSGATPINVSVSEDTEALKELITGFIDGFNSFVTTTNALTAFDVASGTGGPLQGDFSVRSISGQLRQVLTNAVEGFDGPFSNLSELGIATQVDGTLAINDTTLNTVIEENFDDIVGLFAAVGLPSDSTVNYLSSTEDTVVGSYAVEITQAASRGQLVGGIAGFPLTVDANNDEFSIAVDGINS